MAGGYVESLESTLNEQWSCKHNIVEMSHAQPWVIGNQYVSRPQRVCRETPKESLHRGRKTVRHARGPGALNNETTATIEETRGEIASFTEASGHAGVDDACALFLDDR